MCNILHHPPSPSPSLRRRHSLLEAGAHPFAFIRSIIPPLVLAFLLLTHAHAPHATSHSRSRARPHARIYIPRPLSTQSMSMCTSTSALIHSSACCLLCPIYPFPFPLLDFPAVDPCSVLFCSLPVIICCDLPYHAICYYISIHSPTHIYSGSVYLNHSTTYLSYLCPR